jgi:Mn-dependent DtxR family transcriptional regulator
VTKRQEEYLAYMRKFFDENDQLPPLAALADGMGVNPNAAAETVDRLAARGLIEKNVVGKWRWAR